MCTDCSCSEILSHSLSFSRRSSRPSFSLARDVRKCSKQQRYRVKCLFPIFFPSLTLTLDHSFFPLRYIYIVLLWRIKKYITVSNFLGTVQLIHTYLLQALRDWWLTRNQTATCSKFHRVSSDNLNFFHIFASRFCGSQTSLIISYFCMKRHHFLTIYLRFGVHSSSNC